MLPFPRYSPQGVDPHIQTIRAVWPAKGKGGYVTDKPSNSTSPRAPETRDVGWMPSFSPSNRRFPVGSGGLAPAGETVPSTRAISGVSP
jgi:hypothetical protein